jgi:exopolysaccharide production protein ExoZ
MQHYRSIHYLRGIAALCIVIFHTCIAVPAIDPDLKRAAWLESGVSIFFVISGFVMMKSTQHGRKTTGQFLADRFIRIMPIYWVITLYIFLCSPSFYGDMLLPSLFLIPVHFDNGQLQSAIIPPAWTLSLEITFYLLFAFLVRLSDAKKLISTAAIFVAAMALGSLSVSPTVGFYTQPIIIEFWLGMLLGCYHRHGRGWMLPLGIALLYVAHLMTLPLLSARSVGAFILVAGMLSLESRLRENRPLRALGDFSYVLYLSHMFVTTLALPLFGAWVAFSPTTFAFVLIVATIAIAFLIHRYVEIPLVKALKLKPRLWAHFHFSRLLKR